MRPVNVLLWSPNGAGLHYTAPGMGAYRLYSHADPSRLRATLVHGYEGQAAHKVFAAQHLLSPLSSAPASQLRFLFNAKRWLHANGRSFDCLHGIGGFHVTMRPAAWARSFDIPAVVKLAQYRNELVDKAGWRRLLGLPQRRRAMLSTLSAIIAISKDICRELESYGVPRAKIARIPNGVDTSRFRLPENEQERRTVRSTLGLHDLPTILFVGRVDAWKRPHLLVDALSLLRAGGRPCQLVLAGPCYDTGYCNTIRTRVDELGLRPYVVWTGHVSEIAPLYRAADVFALPSRGEGLPNALLEAMSSGLPTVAPPVSGIRELTVHGMTGLITPPSPPAIADSIKELVDDPGLAHGLGLTSRERVLSHYSLDSVVSAHERLFHQLLRGGDFAE